MFFKIKELLPSKYKQFKITKIANGSSRRKYFRLSQNQKQFIFLDSSEEPKQLDNLLKVYKILSQYNISIPKIYEFDNISKTAIQEDFGKLRFDKIFDKFEIKKLLFLAVDSLVIMNNDIEYNDTSGLPVYSYYNFKEEISEFLEYYYPYCFNKKISDELKESFHYIWKSQFNSYKLNFTSLIHKDFNINNLFYLPSRRKQFKCGIIDFQDSFWGENCWDLFSLLEDSRLMFDDQFNEFFIKYYCSKTNQSNMINLFKEKYHFFNCSRQTRLLGRWIKLFKLFNQKYYLNFIEVTNQRLLKSLTQPCMKNIRLIYNKIFPEKYDF